MRIIPAIDIINGQCVRLTEGDYNTVKVYNSDPVEQAKIFEDIGFKYLHLVDLDGAKAQSIQNRKVLEKICRSTNLIVDFGGGLKSEADVQAAYDAGAKQVTLGSMAVQNPELFVRMLEAYGNEFIILGADCRDRKIATQGWLDASDRDVIDFIQSWVSRNVIYTVCTDIAKDGQLKGPSLDLYKEILDRTSIKLIASGGVTRLEDVHTLSEVGCEGTIIGKALYEGFIDLNKLVELC